MASGENCNPKSTKRFKSHKLLWLAILGMKFVVEMVLLYRVIAVLSEMAHIC